MCHRSDGEQGIDIASQRAKSLDAYDNASFDYVVTTCVLMHRRTVPCSRVALRISTTLL